MLYTLVIALLSYLIGVLVKTYIDSHSTYVNLNDFARDITLQEGKKRSIDIAQIKEVIYLVFTKLGYMTKSEVNYLINSHKVDHEQN